MARITHALFASRYSIHDLSRCTGEGEENLARFNMPLELGIAMARRYSRPDEVHDWLVLVPEQHAYAGFASDLAGFDPMKHDGSEKGVVTAVVTWLLTRKDAVAVVTPRQVTLALPAFRRVRKALNRQWRTPPWADVVLAAKEVSSTL